MRTWLAVLILPRGDPIPDQTPERRRGTCVGDQCWCPRTARLRLPEARNAFVLWILRRDRPADETVRRPQWILRCYRLILPVVRRSPALQPPPPAGCHPAVRPALCVVPCHAWNRYRLSLLRCCPVWHFRLQTVPTVPDCRVVRPRCRRFPKGPLPVRPLSLPRDADCLTDRSRWATRRQCDVSWTRPLVRPPSVAPFRQQRLLQRHPHYRSCRSRLRWPVKSRQILCVRVALRLPVRRRLPLVRR